MIRGILDLLKGSYAQNLQKGKLIMARPRKTSNQQIVEVPILKAYATSVRKNSTTTSISFRYEDERPALVRIELPNEAAIELVKQLRG